MSGLARLKQQVRNGVSVAALGYRLDFTVDRAPSAARAAVAKCVDNDLAWLLDELDRRGRPLGIDPGPLPLDDRQALLRVAIGRMQALDAEAGQVALRATLHRALWQATAPALGHAIRAEISASLRAAGVPEDAARVLAPDGAEGLPADLRAEIEAEAEAFAGHAVDEASYEGRYDFLKRDVDRLFAGTPGALVLYFAPEVVVMDATRQTRHAAAVEVVTVDAFNPRADRADDARALDLPDDAYDLIVCHHVLEHILGEGRAIAEFHRVLKPGGRLHVSVPQTGTLARTVEWQVPDWNLLGHVRAYGPDFADRLEAAGFECERRAYREPNYLLGRGSWLRPYYLARKAG